LEQLERENVLEVVTPAGLELGATRLTARSSYSCC
jgi:hypothetical protein